MRSAANLGAVVLGVVALAGCWSPAGPAGEQVDAIRLGGDTMGTRWNATVVAPRDRAPGLEPELLALIDEALDLVDRQMSTWREDSELSRFNRHQDTAPFSLSPETLTVLRLAREVSVASGGAFDVTVGPLVDAWGFGPGHAKPGTAGRGRGRPAAGPGAPPAPESIATLRQRVGYELLTLDQAAGSAAKKHPDLEVDLSAIAPGYAVDLISQRLRERGFGRHLVEVGGELRVAGPNPAGSPWRIAIERPRAERRETQRVVAVRDLAVATSGDYRDFYELDGARYSHTLDPATGSPVRHALASATVIHESCALADAWATAIMALGPGAGLRVAEENGLSVLLLLYQGEGVREITSAEFERRFGGDANAAGASAAAVVNAEGAGEVRAPGAAAAAGRE
ncbi:MAG TPA: FAD:protein FMN transferase [Thermoanaerobaculia bacterium]|nr:FAD:protein FMN transferase [Thermoanaerobaculia bacterium]